MTSSHDFVDPADAIPENDTDPARMDRSPDDFLEEELIDDDEIMDDDVDETRDA
jgi:hypothetical protein